MDDGDGLATRPQMDTPAGASGRPARTRAGTAGGSDSTPGAAHSRAPPQEEQELHRQGGTTSALVG
eukprot:4182825-Pleurochrysis_carterae.AAC.1